MKTVYESILKRLKEEVPALKWIDLDKGQMRYTRPPILFPAALIKIIVPRSENLNSKKQLVNAQIIVKLCFDFTGYTDASTPDEHRLDSLDYFDTSGLVFSSLQGWGTAEMNPLERVSEYDEERPDAYEVRIIAFGTSYHETA